MGDHDARSNQQEVERLRKQRAGLATFGGHALRTDDIGALLQEATQLVSEAIEVELVKILELLPDENTMLVRAGTNWNPGVVGSATFGAHERSPGGYALQTGEPVISNDVAQENRFEIPDLLIQHGVKSMVNVVIRGEEAAWGVLEVDSRERRSFAQDDISFLQIYADFLASAIERVQRHRELEEAAETRRLLLLELQHRVRNMLANVRALASGTRAASANLNEFAIAFDERLNALARTQDLLTENYSQLVGVREIVLQELEAHGSMMSQRLSIQGADESLPHKIIQGLAVAFHELATNAVKYGALAIEDGRIEVSWNVVPRSSGKEMQVRWRERGVNIKGNPSRRGYGSQVIEKSVPYMLGGTSALTFHPDGVECIIRFPIPDEPASAKSPAAADR